MKFLTLIAGVASAATTSGPAFVVENEFCLNTMQLVLYDCKLTNQQKKQKLDKFMASKGLGEFAESMLLAQENCMFTGHHDLEDKVLLELDENEDKSINYGILSDMLDTSTFSNKKFVSFEEKDDGKCRTSVWENKADWLVNQDSVEKTDIKETL